MADPSRPQQPPLSTTQASSDPTSKQKPLPPATMTSATKYDIAPPYPQEAGSSSGPTSSKPLTQASPTTPGTPSVMSGIPSSLVTPTEASLTTPSGNSSKITNSAQLLASARAKLAAVKKTTTPSASKPSPDANVQVFEITHLKTIKCDVCEKKNSEVLYKCQNCPDHHQICSRCVETTEPQPAGITVGRKDWSPHAKLKDAHADYMQAICMHKREDGGYEYDGVKFIMAQGKRSGIKKVRNATPKTKATAVERNSAVHRALGGNKTTQQGKRIEAMARAKLERSQDQDLRARVAAARARRAKQDEADGKAQLQAGEKKRKAAVLDEDDDSSMDVDVENASEVTTEESNDEDSEVTQNDGQGGWDPEETAAAMKESLRDIGRHEGDQSKRVRSQNTKYPRLGAFSPPHSVSSGFPAINATKHSLSVGRMLPHAPVSNHALIAEPFVSGDPGTNDSRVLRTKRPASTTNRAGNPSRTDQMKTPPTTSPYRMQTQFSPSVTDQNKTSEAKMSHHHFSSDSTKQDDKLKTLEQMSQFKMPTMFSTNQDSTSTTKVERSQERARAQQELQDMEAIGAGQEDPYAQDALGIGMLLQAAKVIGDRERAQVLQTGDLMQLDGSPDSDVHNAPSDQPDDNDSRFKDASELDRLSSTHRTPRADMLIASPSIRSRRATSAIHSPNEPHGHKRRRSERLTSTSSPMGLKPQPPSPSPERASKRAKSEQPTFTSRSKSRSKSTHMLTTTTPKPITTESSTASDPSATSSSRQDMIVRQRIKAIRDKATAMSNGTWKPNFPPLVREYIEEQRLRKEKTMQWLERQEQGKPDKVAGEDEEGEENEDEESEDEESEDGGERDEDYDEGVEGGYWIESSGSESQEPVVPGPAETGKGKETKHAQLEIRDSQSASDHDIDAPINVSVNDNDNKHNTANKKNNSGAKSKSQHLTSNPIIPPAPARYQHSADEATQAITHADTAANVNDKTDSDSDSDSAGDTITVHAQPSPRGQGRGRGRRRRLVRGHRKSGSDESR